MIISKTPFRISLIGGGTDFPSYYNDNEGLVIGGTINNIVMLLQDFYPTYLITNIELFGQKMKLLIITNKLFIQL